MFQEHKLKMKEAEAEKEKKIIMEMKMKIIGGRMIYTENKKVLNGENHTIRKRKQTQSVVETIQRKNYCVSL